MKTIAFAICTLAAASMTAVTLANDDGTDTPAATRAPAEADKPPAVPPTPAAVDGILYARRFTLKKGYLFEWSKERPLVTEGMILVLKVDPALVYPRQSLEPVLYVGNQTAERVNSGYRSGRVIAIVPGKLDLKKTPIWFGTPELPERVDAGAIKQERRLAQKAKIMPFETAKIEQAMKRGKGPLEAADRDELRRRLAPLVKQHSPAEKALVNSLEAIPVPSSKEQPEEN